MKTIQMLKSGFVALLLVGSSSGFAGTLENFEQKAFDQAQSEGKTVVLDFYADWCSTCKKQQPLIESLLKEPAFENVTVFKVDFDHASVLKKQVNVQKQSTLVVYKGSKEVARATGLTDRKEIEALFAKGI